MTLAHRLLLKWARTLHVYLTLFGFVLLFFFALTGFMLNHDDWFLPPSATYGYMQLDLLGEPRDEDAIVSKLKEDFSIPGDKESFEFLPGADVYRVVFKAGESSSVAVIQRADGHTEVTRESSDTANRYTEHIVEGKIATEIPDPWDDAKQLPVVEKLRKDFAVRGEMNSFNYEKENVPPSLRVVFKAPGYLATAVIQTKDGNTRVTHQSRGIAGGLLLDLHRGKDTGAAWKLVIDGVSILFVMVSITGLILWSSLRGRAQHGLAVLMLGLALSLAIYFVYVPR